jgi:hypothetical protein
MDYSWFLWSIRRAILNNHQIFFWAESLVGRGFLRALTFFFEKRFGRNNYTLIFAPRFEKKAVSSLKIVNEIVRQM